MKKFILLLAVMFLGNISFAFDVNVYKLDNGHTVIIKEVKTNPIVTIDTWINAGSVNETDKNNGVAHFLEHLFFKGTKKYPAGSFDKILETKGAITNAGTSKDFTHYYITIPSKYFKLAMELHSDMLLNPMLPRKELEMERKVVLEEIAKDEGNPQTTLYKNLNKMLYKNHPYKREVIGKREVIENITREEILQFYKDNYVPQNMFTIIVGDVDTKEALAFAEEYFGQNQKVKTVKKKYPKEIKPLFSTFKKNIEYMDVQSGYMVLSYPSVTGDKRDTYALDILATILGDGKSSILNQKIKEQMQLATSISVANVNYRDDGKFIVTATYSPDNLEKLERAIQDEIEEVQRHGITQQQLEKAKNIVKQDTYYARESISNIASEVGYNMAIFGDIKYYDNYLSQIDKVKLLDVKVVANKYLVKNRAVESVILPKVIRKKANQNIVKKEYKSELILQKGDVKKYKLENGAELLVNQNNVNDIVAISILAKGGNLTEKIPGTAFLMSKVMLKGTSKYSAVELAQLLEENGIKIVPSALSDYFEVNVLTPKNQVVKTLDILEEIFNNATFDDYEIEKERANKLSMIKRSKDYPLNIALDEYKTIIFENSTYSYSNKILEKSMLLVEKDDILKYYNTAFSPENIVISVNGNIDDKLFANRFTDIFSKGGKKIEYNSYINKIPFNKNIKKVVKHVPKTKTSWLVLGYPTCGIENQKDYVTLQIIDTIMGSGMSSRLFMDLRNQEGLAYQVGSSYSPKVLAGSFILYIGTNPQTLEHSKKKMLDEVLRIKREFVSDKELNEAKEKLFGNYVLSQETNLEKAYTLAKYEITDRGFDYKQKYFELINSVTASDVINVANKYFNENYVLSIVEP